MDSDSVDGEVSRSDDLIGLFNTIIGGVQFKFIGMMFLVFLILSTDTFITRVLDIFGSAVSGGCPTSWGTVLQGMFLVLAMLLIDPLIRTGVI